MDPLPARVRLVDAPGELRDRELEVVGWQHRDGVTSVICRLVDGAPGAVPASWTDLPEREPGEPAAVSAMASLAGWRLLLERGERLRRPRRCRVSDETEVTMSGQLALAVSEEEVVAPAAVWETLPVEVQRRVAVRMARLLGRGGGAR